MGGYIVIFDDYGIIGFVEKLYIEEVQKSIVIISVVIVLIISFLVVTGFREKTDIVLAAYSVSQDGTKLIFKTAAPTSMGYVRGGMTVMKVARCEDLIGTYEQGGGIS